jgi:alginate O-acetyltransferase complex protein AlgI
MKIYFDFSAYSDIAIGSARLFGIKVPENFDWPYLRTNIAEFWRHWHMSLYKWLVDYVFIPLGGSRKNPPRVYLNVLITMFLSGLWHGAGLNFIVWGLWHGLLLAGHRLWSNSRGRQIGRPQNRKLVTHIRSRKPRLGVLLHGLAHCHLFLSAPIHWLKYENSTHAQNVL